MDIIDKPKLNSSIMEISIVELLNYRIQSIVPNVSYGLGLHHECDLLVLDNKNRFTEIEIKISKSDLKNDFEKKKHLRKPYLISRLVYAIPIELLVFAESIIPKQYGIITVSWDKKNYISSWYRINKHNKNIKSASELKIKKFLELGVMRIWTLKSKLLNIKKPH